MINSNPQPTLTFRAPSGGRILDTMTQMNVFKPIIAEKQIAPNNNKPPTESPMALRIKYLFYFALGESIYGMFFGDPLKGKNMYTVQDRLIWLLTLINGGYFVLLYIFNDQNVLPSYDDDLALHQLQITLMWYIVIIVAYGAASFIMRIRVMADYENQFEDIDSTEEFLYDSCQYYNAFAKGDKLELKILNHTEVKEGDYKLKMAEQFQIIKEHTKYKDTTTKLFICILRGLVLIGYYWVIGLTFNGQSLIFYPLIVLLFLQSSIYISRIYDSFITSANLSFIIFNSMTSFILQDFQQKMKRIILSKDPYFDIFDPKTLSLTSSARALIMHYNKSKWAIIIGITSLYLKTILFALLVFVLINTLTSGFNFFSFLVNPMTVLTMIDLAFSLNSLNKSIAHTSAVNRIPATQQQFYKEYDLFLKDLISYYQGKCELHSNLYNETVKFLDEKYGGKALKHLETLRYTVKLLLRDSQENTKLLPVIFGMPLTRFAMVQIQMIILFQLISLISSAKQ